MTHIPPRKPQTPEQIDQIKHGMMLCELFNRWLNGHCVPEDDFLLLKHQEDLDRLKKEYFEWYARTEEEMLWKCRQLEPKNTDDNKDV